MLEKLSFNFGWFSSSLGLGYYPIIKFIRNEISKRLAKRMIPYLNT